MSVLDKAIQIFNNGGIRNNDGAISETMTLIEEFHKVLSIRNNKQVKKEQTPEEIENAGRQAIEDFKNMFREEAAVNVPSDMLYQNHENMLEDAMNSLNTANNYTIYKDNSDKEQPQTVQEQKNEGMDR